MARTKNTTESQPEVSTSPATDAKETSGTSVNTKVSENDIPDSVKPILKIFKRYGQIWVDKSGGVFVNKPDEQSGAILYKNPYA